MTDFPRAHWPEVRVWFWGYLADWFGGASKWCARRYATARHEIIMPQIAHRLAALQERGGTAAVRR